MGKGPGGVSRERVSLSWKVLSMYACMQTCTFIYFLRVTVWAYFHQLRLLPSLKLLWVGQVEEVDVFEERRGGVLKLLESGTAHTKRNSLKQSLYNLGLQHGCNNYIYLYTSSTCCSKIEGKASFRARAAATRTAPVSAEAGAKKHRQRVVVHLHIFWTCS